jgi:hypothetical protein
LNSDRFKTLIKVAKKHKIKSLELYKDLVDKIPNQDLKELLKENILAGERKHRRFFADADEEVDKGYDKREYKPGCDDEEGFKHLTIPLKQGAFISKYYPDRNFNDYDALYLGRYGLPENIFRTLMEFKLHKIPDNCTITKAELVITLCTNELPDKGAPITMHPILTDWSEKTVTWNDGPKMAREHWKIMVPGGVLGALCIDVKDYVQDYWECPNHGFMLIGPEFLNGVIGIEAEDYGPHRKAPYLKIEMECGHDE